MSYDELITALNGKAGIVIFIKRDGSRRVMLCTRNRAIACTLGVMCGAGLDVRDSKLSNGKSMAVIDLEKRDIRAFMCDRVISFEDLGDIRSKESYSYALGRVDELRKSVNNISLDSMDII